MFHDSSQHVMLPFPKCDFVTNMGSNIDQCANVTSIPPNQIIFGNIGTRPSILHVVETNCIQTKWHIKHMTPNSKVQCFVIYVFFGKKCKTPIAKGKNWTLAPTYSSLFQLKVLLESQDHNFWFCLNDIHI
jgi:hypothetical protein